MAKKKVLTKDCKCARCHQPMKKGEQFMWLRKEFLHRDPGNGVVVRRSESFAPAHCDEHCEYKPAPIDVWSLTKDREIFAGHIDYFTKIGDRGEHLEYLKQKIAKIDKILADHGQSTKRA